MKILEKQTYHLVFLGLLLAGVYAAAKGEFLLGSWGGLRTADWLWLSILVPSSPSGLCFDLLAGGALLPAVEQNSGSQSIYDLDRRVYDLVYCPPGNGDWPGRC